MNLPQKIVALHVALADAALPHAFGGALALAWCTGRARGTIDIDLNIFVARSNTQSVTDALPTGISTPKERLNTLAKDGQVRFWWDQTPVDVFLNTVPFHEEVAARLRWETFMEQSLPFLCCDDLAVFKAFFNRGKDWVDLEEMVRAGTVDLVRVSGVIAQHLGVADERFAHLQKLQSL